MTHGTLTTYRLHKCRCEPCRVVAAKYQKRLRYDVGRGISRVVDATPAHRKIAELRAHGESWMNIAASLGYTASPTVHRIMRSKRIRVTTLNRILALEPPDFPADRHTVDSVGTRRRLQALAYSGWTLAEVARRAGLTNTFLSDVRRGRHPVVTASTARAVASVFDLLVFTDGGSARARTDAVKGKFAPALAWDHIDDPAERPQGVRR